MSSQSITSEPEIELTIGIDLTAYGALSWLILKPDDTSVELDAPTDVDVVTALDGISKIRVDPVNFDLLGKYYIYVKCTDQNGKIWATKSPYIHEILGLTRRPQ